MGHRARRILLEAPAKVNLYLGVGALRPDGYHDVTTVLQAISLADTVTLTPADTLGVSCTPELDLPAEENLAHRAALAFAEATGGEAAVRIAIDKRIPAGAGLGGASADAAAVLVGLALLAGLDPAGADRPLLDRVAASLGADVPFFLGGGTALFGERGDALVGAVPTPPLELVVVKPAAPVSTPAAYAAFDRSPVGPAPGAGQVLEACAAGEPAEVAQALYNNLAPAAVGIVAEAGEVLGWLRSAEGVLGAEVSGSGSAVFSICASEEAASGLAAAARERGWWAEAATSRPDGIRAYIEEEG